VALSVAVVTIITVRGSSPVRFGHLVDAAGQLDRRIVRGRICGFPYKPVGRGIPTETGLVRARLRSIAAGLLVDRRDEPQPLRETGIASLFIGRRAEAVILLQAAADATPRDGTVWSDLSAALLEKGCADDVPALVRALAAAQHAVHDAPTLPEAAFNRALIMEELHLDQAAVAEYRRSVQLDPTSAWSVEAKERIRRLIKPTRMEAWEQIKAVFAQSSVSVPDDAVLRRIVDQYRQETRGTVEVEVLADWGVAEEAGETAKAKAKLQMARAVGRTFIDATGDSLLAEAVAVIDRASPRDRAVLAQAHRLYREARTLQRDRRPRLAEPIFEHVRLLFLAAGSPMADVVEYWTVNCASDGPALGVAMMRMRASVRHLPPRYRSLSGLWAWQEATMMSRIGMHNEALAAYNRAFATFDALGEVGSRTHMLNAVAFTNASLGRTTEAWTIREELFRFMSESGKPELGQSTIDAAARTELAAGNMDTAHALFAIAAAMTGPNPRLHFDAVLWQALTAERLGWKQEAARSLQRARAASQKIADPSLRQAADDDLRLATALLVADPLRRASLLTAYIEAVTRRTDTIHLPSAYAERARAHVAAGNLLAAQSDFALALSEIESRGEGVDAPDFRDSYFARTDAVIRELADVLDRSGDQVGALAANERWRARMLDRSAVALQSAAEIRNLTRLLPPDLTLVEYVALPNRLLVFKLTRRGIDMERIAIGREALRRRADEFANGVRRGTIDHRRAAELYRLLGSPAAQFLVIVPDPALDSVPFAALVDPADKKYLIQRSTLVFAPSATAFVAALQRRGPLPPHPRALVVGDPHFDVSAFALAPLPASRREAAVVASLYGAAPLIGGAAAKDRVVEEMSRADVVHIGSHAVTGGDDPQRSCLVLAPSAAGPGALYVHELARLPLSNVRVVVVAGCRSARATDAANSLRNIALAFNAAGAANAIGSSWDIDDATGARIFGDLHRRLLTGTSPSVALQETQLSLMRSPSSRLSSPAEWANLRLYGAGR
jgi:CHAT domain-containing protein